MKKILALLLSLALVFSLAGCSLFGGGEGSDEPEGEAAGSELKITDEYTHKDPEGLEYEKRYSYYSGETCDMGEAFTSYYGVTPIGEYIIVYADKDDVALAQYTYIVMESEEDAEKFAGFSDDIGTEVKTFGNVTLQEQDKEALANTIDSFIGMQVLDDTSAETYANMLKEMDMLIDYNPQ